MFLDWVFQVINNKVQGIQKTVSSTTGKKRRFTLSEMGEEERVMGTAPGAARSQPVHLRDGVHHCMTGSLQGGGSGARWFLLPWWGVGFHSPALWAGAPPPPGPWSCGPSV